MLKLFCVNSTILGNMFDVTIWLIVSLAGEMIWCNETMQNEEENSEKETKTKTNNNENQ